MKNICKTILYLQMTALFLTTALAGPAANQGLPFHGSIQAFETSIVQPPILAVEASGYGNATRLGRFMVTYEAEVTLSTRAAVGTTHFIAANGDTIFTQFIGQGNPIAGTDFSFIVERNIIIGGTGRFAGATGSFTVERLLNRVTGVTIGAFDGTIILDN